jgi:xanthine dehydrogenase accessory factor
MKLEILSTLNAERAARRAVAIVTDIASGAQRLVKAAEISADPLREVLQKHLHSGRVPPLPRSTASPKSK